MRGQLVAHVHWSASLRPKLPWGSDQLAPVKCSNPPTELPQTKHHKILPTQKHRRRPLGQISFVAAPCSLHPLGRWLRDAMMIPDHSLLPPMSCLVPDIHPLGKGRKVSGGQPDLFSLLVRSCQEYKHVHRGIIYLRRARAVGCSSHPFLSEVDIPSWITPIFTSLYGHS